jgi:hypothetical protein
MLERKLALRCQTVGVEKLRLLQLQQDLVESRPWGDHTGQDGITEHPPDHRRGLEYGFQCRRQPINARQQDTLHCGWHIERCRGCPQAIARRLSD